MVRAFDPCEVDFFGDLAGDTHVLWEVFEFVRLHHSDLSDEQVFERGRQYLADWIAAGWIRVSDTPLHPSTITSLAQIPEFLQRHGSAVTGYLDNSPSIDITEEAQRVYESQTI
jgi:hypothetical protein